MWQIAIELGVGAMFGLPFLKAAVKSSPKIVGMIHDHFTRHNDVLGEAWVDSYGKAMTTLGQGLGGMGFFESVGSKIEANLLHEFRQNIEHKYLRAFEQQIHLSKEQLKNLKTAAGEILRTTGKSAQQIYPKKRWPKEIEVARIFDSPTQNQEIERALLNDIFSQASAKAILQKNKVSDQELEQLLCFEGMLLSAILYFFRDHLLNDARIKSAMDTLRQQGLRTDIKHLGEQMEAQRSELEAQRAQQAKILEQQEQQHQETQANLRALEQRLTETQAQIAEAFQKQNFGALASLSTQAQEIQATQEQQRAALEQVTQVLEKQQEQLHGIESSLSRIEGDNQRLREEMQKEFEEAKVVWGGFERQLQGFGDSLGELRDELRGSISQVKESSQRWMQRFAACSTQSAGTRRNQPTDRTTRRDVGAGAA